MPRGNWGKRHGVAPRRGNGAGVHRGCGRVPAEVAGTGLVPFHSAAAS